MLGSQTPTNHRWRENGGPVENGRYNNPKLPFTISLALFAVKMSLDFKGKEPYLSYLTG